ncbi:MAG: ABC transporter permease [Sphingobacteriales bacterium]|nr:MAG: ABC transporter permease [Sphingobacteriales bacterium]
MSKTGLIISREYFTRVKKKSFLLTTILVPIVIIGFYAAIIAISIKGGTEETAVAVLDESGILNDSSAAKNKSLKLTFIQNETEESFTKKYKEQGYKAFLYVPKFNIDSTQRFVVHSQSSLSLSSSMALERMLNNAIENKRLQAKGIDPAVFKSIKTNVSLDNTIDSKEGGKKGSAGVAYGVSFLCGILIYMMMIIYGTQVMRGVMEEKTNRIAEVIVSSVKPFQLMLGKIIGIGAVGLTQFAIWIVLMIALQSLIPLFFPGLMDQVTSSGNVPAEAGMVNTVMQGISSLPIAKIVSLFLFYFLAGYLTYASLFAAIGSVVSEDQQDAQQLVFPVLMPIILGFVIMTQSINNPNSSLAVFGSLFPLTSPIVMMGRITYDIPFWQLATSMLLLVGCFIFFTWITGKIYRTGILMYGKKPSWKEMMKWAFRKS